MPAKPVMTNMLTLTNKPKAKLRITNGIRRPIVTLSLAPFH